MIPVLFIAYHFPPIGGAGVQRSQKFVRYLPAEGFLPIVVTGPGVAGDRWSPEDAAPNNEFFPEVQVVRAPGPVPQSSSNWTDKLGRWFAAQGAFADWWIQAGAAVAAQSMNGAKLIFATMSPFSTARVAGDLGRGTGIPWVADLRDPWALDEMQIYPSWLHRKMEMARMERSLLPAAGIIMNTPEATAALRRAFPSLAEKTITTITNGYDKADFAEAAPPRSDGKFRVVHTGYLHTDTGIQVQRRRAFYELLGGMESDVDILTRSHLILLKAVEQWIGRHGDVAHDLEMVFAGVATEQDKQVAMKSSVSDFIRFPGYLSHSDSVQLVRTADLLFLPMHNLQVGKRSRIVPGKAYEYMASGRPILAAVPDGDARDFLHKSGTALLCRPDDVDGMVQHLDHVYCAWKNGRSPVVTPNRDFISSFERSRLTHKLACFFDEVLQSHSRRGSAAG
jgi:glycosyltransferase involved in cell wall biosynthesis